MFSWLVGRWVNLNCLLMLVLFILPVPSGYDPGPMKYSLLTQFLRLSGILPIMALLISEAAISLSSVADASLKQNRYFEIYIRSHYKHLFNLKFTNMHYLWCFIFLFQVLCFAIIVPYEMGNIELHYKPMLNQMEKKLCRVKLLTVLRERCQ